MGYRMKRLQDFARGVRESRALTERERWPRERLERFHFDVPTTVARKRGSLFLPNARFTTPPAADTDYWVTRVG